MMKLNCRHFGIKAAQVFAVMVMSALVQGEATAQSTEIIELTTSEEREVDPAELLTAVATVRGSGEQEFFGPGNFATFRVDSRLSSQNKIRTLMKKLKAAEDTKTKNAVEQEIQEVLSGQYDQKMQVYEKHLAELESKLEKMRSQLQRRRDAKAEMVDLRLKVLMAEADDLGWPGDVRPNRFPTVFGSNGIGTNDTIRGGARFVLPPAVPATGKSITNPRWNLSTDAAKTVTGAKKVQKQNIVIEADNIEELKAASDRLLKEYNDAKAKADGKK